MGHVFGSGPVHVHKPKDGESWECNSTYCQDITTESPEKGGPKVIRMIVGNTVVFDEPQVSPKG